MRELTFFANGLRLSCLDYGGEGRRPLLFLHGGSAHAHWWDFVAPAFTDSFHVLAVDQRGHGESQWPDDWAYGSRHYVSDLHEIISSWKFGAPVLVGHSMGAHNVLVYATEHPELLRAIVVIDALPVYSELAVNFLRGFADRPPRRFATLDEAIANFRVLPRETLAKKEILDYAARHTFKQLPDGAWTHKLDRRTLIREPLDVSAALGRITCPALIVKMSQSRVLDRAAADRMASAMANGRVVEVADSYHHVMFDNPEGLIAVLKPFFAALPA